jgi:hypothetical protein
VLEHQGLSERARIPDLAGAQELQNSEMVTLFDLSYSALTTRIGQPNGTLIGSVPAKGTGLGTVYSLTANPNNAFAIDSTTGQISIADTTQLAGMTSPAAITVRQTNSSASNSPKDTSTSITIQPALDAFSWNPSDINSVTLSNSNLTAACSGGGPASARTKTAIPTTGKWYWEVHADANPTTDLMMGIADGTLLETAWWYSGGGTHSVMVYGGSVDYNGGPVANIGGLATNDVIQFAYDAAAKVLYIGRNGVWQLGNPSAGTGG